MTLLYLGPLAQPNTVFLLTIKTHPSSQTLLPTMVRSSPRCYFPQGLTRILFSPVSITWVTCSALYSVLVSPQARLCSPQWSGPPHGTSYHKVSPCISISPILELLHKHQTRYKVLFIVFSLPTPLCQIGGGSLPLL